MRVWRQVRALYKRGHSVFNGRQRKQIENLFSDELESHLQLHIDDNLRQGMNYESARREAILSLGGVEMTKQIYRERTILPLMDDFLQDLSFAFRQLRRAPGFTGTAILMLTLGIGASVAMFAFVDAALLKPLPYRDPNRLASVTETVKLIGRANLSYPDYLDWKRMNTVFSSLEVYGGGGGLLNTPTGALPVSTLRISDGFFHTLGVKPMLGRDFRPGEDLAGTGDLVILSYAGWQKWFAGRPDTVGQTVHLNGIPNTIIGVMPESFDFAPRGGTDFYTPLHAKGECDLRRSCHSLEGIARLKDGVTMQAALQEMKAIAAQLELQYPGDNRGQGATVDPLSEIIVGDVRPILLTLLTGATLLLVIACINVSSLLLVRSESRRLEMAVREALGASRARLTRQFVTEGTLLVAIATALGLGLAYLAMQGLTRLIPVFMMSRMPFLHGLGLSAHVLLFAGGVVVVAIVLFAVTPLLRLPFGGMRGGLAEGGRGSAGTLWRRFASNMVVFELAIAVVLLTGAGLLGKSFYRLLHVNPHFQTDHVAMLGVMAPETLYPKDEDNMRLQQEIERRVGALPGVQSVSMASVPPLSFNGNTDWIRFVGRPYNGEHNEVNARDITADHMKTLRAKMLSGRMFTEQDDLKSPKVAIINQALAKLYYPNQNPIGQRFGNGALDPKSIKVIVGVVDDIKEGSLDSDIWPTAYYPMYQDEDNYYTLLVRTSVSEASVLPTLVSTIHSIDPGIGIDEPTTMEIRTSTSPTAYLHRSSAWLVGGFAALALLLGVIGLYGVIAYSVSQRTREIGVRMALGAQRGSVYGLVMGEAGRLTLIGICLGLISSIGAATFMRKLLFNTAAWDAWTLISVALVLGASTMFASYIPAHRAASVNPAEALRAE